MKVNVLGVQFDSLTMDEAVEEGMRIIEQGRRGYVVTPNPEIVWLCRKDAALRQAVASASLVLPDGIGIIYGARLLGTPLKEKVAGIEFAEGLIARLAGAGKSLFLFGAKPGRAEAAAERLVQKYPGLVIAGTNDGYFSDDGPIIEKINAAAPDLLIVCLGAPKQELWMSLNAGGIGAGLMAGLGGVIDVFSGNAQRAPEALRRRGLEWLYRLLKEPRRVGRMMCLPLFLLRVVWRRLTGR